jgi:electron transport complex protein RnfG
VFKELRKGFPNNISTNTWIPHWLSAIIGVCIIIACLTVTHLFTKARVTEASLNFDRQNLQQFFMTGSYDNDLLVDTFYLSAGGEQDNVINLHLLGLRQDRLAYVAKNNDEVIGVVVPATADDGFNGFVDLMVAVDMFGHITAARVVKHLDSGGLYGVVDVIESQWMKEFDGNAMRDILGISWQKIEADNEYDQFVGASITPKTVSDRIYSALVFVQSNRMALIAGDN